jgi:hypothetical protein
VATGGPPAARRDASLVLDTTNERLIVYGGRDGSGTFADVWALSLGVSPAWTQLSAGAPPGARYGHSAAVDDANSRMLVFGGRASAVTPALGDLWAMALSGPPTWTALSPSGTPPAARDMHTAVVDPARHRMLVQGGEATGVPLGDLWSLALSGPLAWTALNPAGGTPPSRYAQAAVWAPDLDAMLVADGHGGGGTLNDAWSLDAYTVASVPEARVSVAALAAPHPDPARTSVTLSFTLARAGETRLEVFDLAGRRMRRLVGGTMTAGPHEAGWDLRDESGRAVPAGVYLARLVAPGASGVRRFVVLR